MPNEQRDTRIVEMHFENRQFERSIAKSQKTLEDFKKELNFEGTSKGLKKFFQDFDSINFNNLSTNIQRLTDKFTGLGDAGEWVLSRIRHSLESTALQMESFIKSFTTAQISVGQSKYDSLNKAAQALIASGKTSDEAYGIFERVMQYTDQTSANFQVMVDKLQEFTSTGRGLQESERALEGIFNMTAKFGKGATEASNAMGTFSKAMGQGYLRLEQWQSLNTTAHIVTTEFRNELLKAAAAVGDLTEKEGRYYTKAQKGAKSVEVTAENLETTLSRKWATKNTMMALFDRYYFANILEPTDEELEEFAGVAYKSAQRALTFADAMNAVKEAVSSGWMKTFLYVFGDVTEAMEFFTNLCEKVIEGIEGIWKTRNKILEVWSLDGGRQSLIDSILGDYGKEVETGAFGLLDLFDSIGKLISDGFWNMVKIFARGDEQLNWDKDGYKEAWLGGKLIDLSNNIKTFLDSIRSFFSESVNVNGQVKTRLQMVQDAVNGVAGVAAIAYQVISGLVYFFVNLKAQLQPSFDAIRNLFATVGEAIYGSANDLHKSNGIIDFFNNLLITISPVTGAINTLIGTIASMAIKFIEWGSQSGFFASAIEFLSSVFTAIGRVASTVGVPVLNFFTNLFSILTRLISGGFSKKAFAQFGADLSGLLKNSLDGIKNFLKNTKIGPFVDTAWKKIEAFFGDVKLKDRLKKASADVSKFFKDFKLDKFLKDARSRIEGFFKNVDISKFFSDTYKKISAGLPTIIKTVADKLKTLFTFGKNFLSDKSSIFANIVDFFKGGFANVKDFFKGLDVGSFIENVFRGLRNVLSKVAGWFENVNLSTVLSAVLGILLQAELFRTIRNIRKGTGFLTKFIKDFTGESTVFEDFGNTLLKIAASLAIVAAAIYALGVMDPKVLTQGAIVTGAILVALGVLIFTLSKFDIKKDTAKGLKALALVIYSFASAIKQIVKAVIPLSKLNTEEWLKAMGGLAIVMFGLVKVIKSLAGIKLGKKDLAGIAYIILSIGFLIFSIQPFAKMDWPGLVKSLLGLIAVMGVLLLFSVSLKKLKITSVQLAGISAVASAVALLVVSTIPFAFMTWKALARSLLGLLGVLGILVLFAAALKKFNVSTVQLAGITALAGGIAILVLSLLPLALMKPSAIFKALGGLVGILVILGAFGAAINKFNISTVKLVGIIGLAGGIALLTLALLPIAFMPTDRLKQALWGLFGIVSIIAMFFLAIGAMQKVFGVMGTLQTIVASLAIAVVLVVTIQTLSAALNKVKDIPSDRITAFSTALLVVLTAVVASIAVMSMIPVAASIKGILVIAAGIIAISAALSIAVPMLINAIGNSFMDFSAKLALIASTLGDFSSRMNGVDEGGIDRAGNIFDKLKNLMTRLSGFGSYARDISDFSTALFDLSTGLEIFQGHTRGLSDPAGSNAFKMVDKVLSYGGSLATFSVGSISSEIYELASGLYGFDYIGSKMSDPTESKPLALIGQLAAMAPSIELLSSLNTTSLQGSLAGLGGALSLYAAGAKDATGIEPGEMTNTEGAVAVLNAIIDSLVKNGGFTIPELPDESSLGVFGAQLAALAGAIIKFTEASNGLGEGTDKAIDLLDFLGGELKQKLTADNLAAAKVFKESGITPYGLAEFAIDIIALGGAIGAFVDSTKGITENGMKTATDALTFFAGLKTILTAEDAIIGVLNFFTGNQITEDSMATFGRQIEQLGLALKAFATSVTWNEEQEGSFQNALDALEFLAGLESKMPKVGGIVSFFTGQQQDLNNLAAQTENLGTALSNFNSKLVDDAGNPIINKTAMDAGISALNNIINFLGMMQRKMLRIPGLIEKVFTGQTYNTDQLVTDVKNVKDTFTELGKLSKYVSGDDGTGTKIIEADQLKAPLKSLQSIMDFARGLSEKMPKVGGFINNVGKAFTGEDYSLTDLQNSTKNFKDVCKELSTLSGYLLGGEGETQIIDTDKFGETTKVLDALTTFSLELSAKMGTVGGLANAFKSAWHGKDYSLTDLGSDLKGLGEGLGGFSTGLGTGFDPTSVTAAVNVAQSIANILSTLNSIGDGSGFDVMIYTGAFRELLELFNGTGQWGDASGLAESIVNLMSTVSQAYSKYTVDSTAITAFAAMAEALKNVTTIDPTFNFESVGMSIGTGIATGITNSTSSITTAAKNAAIAAYNAAMNALNAHSPSKLFMDVGGFITAGMAIGIDRNSDEVRSSATLMSEEALNGATSVLSIISDLMDENLDVNPTIAPVLDLTNMQNGMMTMDQWLAADRSMSIDTSAAGRMASNYMPNSTTPEINQNGTDYSGIYDHMRTLGEQITALGDQVAKMQIILDTGAVAGAVAPHVDAFIGEQMFFGERGN